MFYKKKKKLNFIVVIPARYKSTRLEGKPLLNLSGVPMIIRTYRQCLKAVSSRLIYIATDNNLVRKACLNEGAQVIMTSSKCLTGTDRVAEVSRKIDAKNYINVQGDEPVFNPKDLEKLIKEIKKNHNKVIMGYCEIDSKKAFKDPNIPKVVINNKEQLLYISRAPIPSNKQNKFKKGWRQVCAYAFPKKSLKIFSSSKRKTKLESIEDLEILRFLELGEQVKAIKMSRMSLAVDTAKDIVLAEDRIRKLSLN